VKTSSELTERQAIDILISTRAFLMERAIGDEAEAIEAKHLLKALYDVVQYIKRTK